jgi:hypothetical protein
VTKVMTKNIEDLLYRGDSLEKMGEMSGRLREDSRKYKKAAMRINWELLLKMVGCLFFIYSLLFLPHVVCSHLCCPSSTDLSAGSYSSSYSSYGGGSSEAGCVEHQQTDRPASIVHSPDTGGDVDTAHDATHESSRDDVGFKVLLDRILDSTVQFLYDTQPFDVHPPANIVTSPSDASVPDSCQGQFGIEDIDQPDTNTFMTSGIHSLDTPTMNKYHDDLIILATCPTTSPDSSTGSEDNTYSDVKHILLQRPTLIKDTHYLPGPTLNPSQDQVPEIASSQELVHTPAQQVAMSDESRASLDIEWSKVFDPIHLLHRIQNYLPSLDRIIHARLTSYQLDPKFDLGPYSEGHPEHDIRGRWGPKPDHWEEYDVEMFLGQTFEHYMDMNFLAYIKHHEVEAAGLQHPELASPPAHLDPLSCGDECHAHHDVKKEADLAGYPSRQDTFTAGVYSGNEDDGY